MQNIHLLKVAKKETVNYKKLDPKEHKLRADWVGIVSVWEMRKWYRFRNENRWIKTQTKDFT